MGLYFIYVTKKSGCKDATSTFFHLGIRSGKEQNNRSSSHPLLHGKTKLIMYNYTDAQFFDGAHFGEGSQMQDILLDNVRCFGFEASLFDCIHRPIHEHNCEHSQDAGVQCMPSKYCMTTHSSNMQCMHGTTSFLSKLCRAQGPKNNECPIF